MRRYPGTTPFKPDDAPVYKGRTVETQEVTNLILTQKTLILFSKSGMGKTSLLNAGVVPKLKPYGLYPVFIRFNEIGSSGIDTPVTRFKAQLEDAYKKFIARQARAKPYNPQGTLWESMCQNQFETWKQVLIPVLIFDQFEEFFQTYPKRKERTEFLNQLAELLSDAIPQQQPLPSQRATATGEVKPLNVRVVFSIRADRLNLMHEVSDYLPFVMRSRYELLPMSLTQATDAIQEPGKVDNGSYETGPIIFPQPVIDDILAGLQDSNSGEIESFQLQLVCSYLENKYIQKRASASRSQVVNEADYGGKEGIEHINKVYFSETINAITEQPRHKIMAQLITLLNSNDNRILKEDSQLALLPSVKDKLVDRRILKREKIQANIYYEISHDKIALALQEEKKRIEKVKLQEQVLIFGVVAVVLVLVAGEFYRQKLLIKEQNNTLVITEKVLTATVSSLTTTQANLCMTLDTLSAAKDSINTKNVQLNSTINSLNLAKVRKAWSDFENAKELMKGKLFDRALSVLPEKQDMTTNVTYRFNNDKPPVYLKTINKRLNKLIEQAKRICERMKEVQSLVEKAECMELNLYISCARISYQNAKKKQDFYQFRYGSYLYDPVWLDKKIQQTNQDIAKGIKGGLNSGEFLDKYKDWLDSNRLAKITDSTNCMCVNQKMVRK